jgi:hypothetical protein
VVVNGQNPRTIKKKKKKNVLGNANYPDRNSTSARLHGISILIPSQFQFTETLAGSAPPEINVTIYRVVQKSQHHASTPETKPPVPMDGESFYR